MNERFSEYEQNKLLLLSTILDPRFKDRVFSGEYEKFQAQNELKLKLDVI